jgi:hypothetical protein
MKAAKLEIGVGSQEERGRRKKEEGRRKKCFYKYEMLPLRGLRNTVFYAELPNASDADIHRMFLYWLDEFTSGHLMLLRYLHEGTYNASQRQI